MAEKDKVIKSGQLTLPRLLFLAVVGAVVVFTVYQGGVFLTIGYWLMTLSICVLLYLIAIDYGVKMEKIELHHMQQAATIAAPAVPPKESPRPAASAGEPRAKRRGARPAKRRR
jgi:hypothetical protein